MNRVLLLFFVSLIHVAGAFAQSGEKIRAIMLHGFAANPFEIRDLTRYVQPFTIEIDQPTLSGFGGSADDANKAKFADWRDTLLQSYAKSAIDEKVVLIGFSTGATAVIDYLLNNKDDLRRVKAVILLSPYLRTHSALINGLNNTLSIFTDTVSPNILYQISGNRDLEPFIAYPEEYTESLPLEAGKQVVAWGKQVRKRINALDKPLSVPVLISYSEADKTIHTKSLPGYMAKLFENPQYVVFEKELAVPHQIGVSSINVYMYQLGFAISNFIKSLN